MMDKSINMFKSNRDMIKIMYDNTLWLKFKNEEISTDTLFYKQCNYLFDNIRDYYIKIVDDNIDDRLPIIHINFKLLSDIFCNFSPFIKLQVKDEQKYSSINYFDFVDNKIKIKKIEMSKKRLNMQLEKYNELNYSYDYLKATISDMIYHDIISNILNSDIKYDIVDNNNIIHYIDKLNKKMYNNNILTTNYILCSHQTANDLSYIYPELTTVLYNNDLSNSIFCYNTKIKNIPIYSCKNIDDGEIIVGWNAEQKNYGSIIYATKYPIFVNIKNDIIKIQNIDYSCIINDCYFKKIKMN